MAVKERQALIIALCQEAGDTGSPDALIEDWEANHACCCALHLDQAAQGDPKTLNAIRTCMGLTLVSATPLAGC